MSVIRGIVVGNRLAVDAWSDLASATHEIERIVGLAVPHLARDQPNLIVLGELLGLPGGLMGRRGVLARRQRTAQRALTLLALADLPQVLAMRRRFPGVTLVQALLLARTDALYQPLAETLPRLARAYNATIVAGTAAPRVTRSADQRLIRRYGQPGATAVYLPVAPAVYNIALVATPDGKLHRVEKVFLTASEQQMLHLSAGRLAEVPVIATPAGPIGVAISLDAFIPDYLHHLDQAGAALVVQPDANDQLWAAPSRTCDWQPQEWLGSVLGSVQPEYPHLRANLCAMQTGMFFDIVFDGQSTITIAGPDIPRVVDNFVGNSGFIHTVSGKPLTGQMLAIAPWVIPDPVLNTPDLALAERRALLGAAARELLPGGSRAGAFRESVIWSDIVVDN